MNIDTLQNNNYAYPVAHIGGSGLASRKVAAQAAIIAVFLCVSFSPISYDGVNGALARVAGATPVRLTPLILSPMISLVGDGFTTYYRVAIMNTLQPQSVQNLPVVFWQDQPVITTDLLASVYETDVNNIKQNFSRNAERFVEGIHFYKLVDQYLKDFKNWVTNSHSVEIPKNTRNLILWTERGTVRHAKMLGTDKAWDVQDQLEQFYFSQKAAQPLEKTEQLTLADIERLIDQKLKQHPLLEQSKGKYIYNAHPPFNHQVRVVMDWQIEQLNEQLAQQGYRLVRI